MPNTDNVLYRVNTTSLSTTKSTLTKRIVLSEIAKLYDPTGLIGPVILYAKLLMQALWNCHVSWDESVPSDVHTKWSQFAQQLSLLNDLQLERCLLIEGAQIIELHGFCDASQNGYGACIYIRSMNQEGKLQCRLLCSKSRVAPLKGLTIPRAELCGALLLVKLHLEVIRNITHKINSTYFWTDSMIVLYWLRSSPAKLKVFIANRVSEIQTHTSIEQWRHVPSENNASDSLSREQLPYDFLRNTMWFTGPSFLKEQVSIWPPQIINQPINQSIDLSSDVVLREQRECTSYLTICVKNLELLKRFSSYSKMIRVISYCRRFKSKSKGLLSKEELRDTEICLLTLLQTIYFNKVIQEIKNSRESLKITFASLSPFIDENGLLRVGGRLNKAKISFSCKHPILLPSRCFITDLLIRQTHIDNHHTGIQSTLSIVRQRFWIFDGKNQVRKIIQNCVTCFRYRAEAMNYKMANLPAVRIQQARPFQNTGVDFCGPFFIKEKKYRNRGKLKIYVSVFICMVTKAIHLEVVSELTTEAFIAALKRFISRRGVPDDIFSDNGTNFIGANNELHELYQLLQTNKSRELIHNFSIVKNIHWHFSIPLSPHHGGIWEAAVKNFKHHFKRIVGNQLYSFEDFNTLTIEIEAILNSRPICSLSSDPNDPIALTPAHFLIGQPMTMLPEMDVTTTPQNRLSSWRLINQARQHFWNRWYIEYLHELQRRKKWVKNEENIKINAVVLIKDNGLPCMQWLLARVIQLHPGDDGVVRSATVKTSTSTYKRSVKIEGRMFRRNSLRSLHMCVVEMGVNVHVIQVCSAA
ncbi:uncharacterized protein [Prorops nasuta]|uniref:uncharacterized protein n=1 Tax=Prorops nasuta TaxID=863751 RepID=UPI0034CE363F